MKEFAITMCLIIVCIIQHLLNWLWRKADFKEDLLVVMVSSFMAVLITYRLFYYALTWYCNK